MLFGDSIVALPLETPLEIRVIQNPKLFGGDIVGYSGKVYNNDIIPRLIKVHILIIF